MEGGGGGDEGRRVETEGGGLVFFFQAEDGIRDFRLSRGLGDVNKSQNSKIAP